ncbi:hypothetical protein CRYUN_Cryun03dG0114900 [Craigia yunnanensis]
MNPRNYVLLCNVYVATGLWSEGRQMRTFLKENGLRKPLESVGLLLEAKFTLLLL